MQTQRQRRSSRRLTPNLQL